MIYFSDVINFDNSANKLIKMNIKNSTDNDLKLKKHCDVIVLSERSVNNESINFSPANLCTNSDNVFEKHDKLLK